MVSWRFLVSSFIIDHKLLLVYKTPHRLLENLSRPTLFKNTSHLFSFVHLMNFVVFKLYLVVAVDLACEHVCIRICEMGFMTRAFSSTDAFFILRSQNYCLMSTRLCTLMEQFSLALHIQSGQQVGCGGCGGCSPSHAKELLCKPISELEVKQFVDWKKNNPLQLLRWSFFRYSLVPVLTWL